MQEEVNQKTVALSIRTTKLTGKVLAAALGKVARAVQKHHRKALTPQGRQSVKKMCIRDRHIVVAHQHIAHTVLMDSRFQLFHKITLPFSVPAAANCSPG